MKPWSTALRTVERRTTASPYSLTNNSTARLCGTTHFMSANLVVSSQFLFHTVNDVQQGSAKHNIGSHRRVNSHPRQRRPRPGLGPNPLPLFHTLTHAQQPANRTHLRRPCWASTAPKTHIHRLPLPLRNHFPPPTSARDGACPSTRRRGRDGACPYHAGTVDRGRAVRGGHAGDVG